MTEWFDDVPIIGKLAPEKIAEVLRELGDFDAAASFDLAAERPPTRPTTYGLRDLLKPPPWQHATHAFGYLGPRDQQGQPQSIVHAGAIDPDRTLQGARVNVTLDHLGVFDYPGSGQHRVLFDFYAQHQAAENTEHLHFNATYRVRDREDVGLVGYPIFVGLRVGTEGLSFKCFTVNVKNDDDEAFLGFMESDSFRSGLRLVETAQPAIGLLSTMAMGLTRSMAKRRRNVPVQDFFMGLDFSSRATGARLATGSYVAVQIPPQLERVWRWDDWEYQPTRGLIVRRDDPDQTIPFNYVIIGVDRSVA
ncbi:MAG: hypothetical protein ABIY55_08900 [Kofleriaceae bacterium]